MKHIVQFSGGKDSTAMLLMMLEKDMPVDEIIFCDTGKEFPQMYEHIQKVEQYIGRKVTRLKAEKSFDYYMFEHKKTRGKNQDHFGYGWPTIRGRWCTSKLKIDVTNKYLKNAGEYYSYIGIAYDEPKRHYKELASNIKHPLFEWQITEAEALKYCYKHGFDWGGLYKHFKRVSCWLCPLQALSELRILRKYYPDLWQILLDMDKKSPNQFKIEWSVEDLEKRFNLEDKQERLF